MKNFFIPINPYVIVSRAKVTIKYEISTFFYKFLHTKKAARKFLPSSRPELSYVRLMAKDQMVSIGINEDFVIAADGASKDSA